MDNKQKITALKLLDGLPKNVKIRIFNKLPRKPKFFNLNTYNLFKQNLNKYNAVETNFRKDLKKIVSANQKNKEISSKSYNYLEEFIDTSDNIQIGDIILANSSSHPERPMYFLYMVGYHKKKNKKILLNAGESIGRGNILRQFKRMPIKYRTFIQRLNYTNVIKALLKNKLLNVNEQNVNKNLKMSKAFMDFEIEKITGNQINNIFNAYMSGDNMNEILKRVYSA